MTKLIIDPERLAALLDGRLNEAERAELLELLASSDDAFETYLDAMAITQQIEQVAAEPGVIPLERLPRAQGRRWPGNRRWLAIAAMMVGLALIPALWMQRGARDLRDASVFVGLLEAERAGHPPGWNSRPWSTTRSEGDPLTPRARAVRAGAGLTDLELAVRSGDSGATARLATDIAVLLEAVPASGPLVALYREVARRSGEPLERLEPLLEQGRDSSAQLLGEDFVALGAWTEAARIAAARRDMRFFRNQVSRVEINSATKLVSLDPSARASLDRVQAITSAKGALDWGALEHELAELLRILAR